MRKLFSLMKAKEKLPFIFLLLLLIVSLIYWYLNHLQENYDSVQMSGDRCISELNSVKYQLNVVTEYKNRIDKLLTEIQNAHDTDKERFKEIMESCVAMRQQTTICQSQFEDLQGECKKTKDDLNRITKELETLKSAR